MKYATRTTHKSVESHLAAIAQDYGKVANLNAANPTKEKTWVLTEEQVAKMMWVAFNAGYDSHLVTSEATKH